MLERMMVHLHSAQVNGSCELVKMFFRCGGHKWHREKSICGLIDESILQIIQGRIEMQFISRNVRRLEKWKSLDMIPVGMGQEDRPFYRLPERKQRVAQFPDPGAAVYYYESPIFSANLDTGSVSSISYCRGPRRRDGASRSPEANLQCITAFAGS